MPFTIEPVANRSAAAAIAGKSVVTQAVWQQMLPEFQLDAFIISGVEAMDVVQRIRDAIAEIPLGEDWEATRQRITEELGPWFGTEEEASRRAELLMRLHGFRAYQATQHRLIMAHADAFPYCQYVCTLDGRERATHGALHGKVLPTSHPWWQTHTGPWEWGCRCEKVPLTLGEAEEIKGEDLTRLPERRQVLDGAILNRLETSGHLMSARPDPRGGWKAGPAVEFDVRTPRERGESDFEWRAGDTGMDLQEIESRYDAATWATWRAWAQQATLPDGRTVWKAMAEKESPAK